MKMIGWFRVEGDDDDGKSDQSDQVSQWSNRVIEENKWKEKSKWCSDFL